MNTKEIKKIAVIGSGVLGTQIAMLAASVGQKVNIFDPKEEAFNKSYLLLLPSFQRGMLIPADQLEACKEKISQKYSIDEALEDVELVIETVSENIEIKKVVFSEIGSKVSLNTIIATNSSSIPISKLEESSGKPEQCLNIHFYQPIDGVRMVDIMGGTKTHPEILERASQWANSLSCVPIRVNKEVMGFCFNSIWRAVKKQCLYLWAGGFVDFHDIDKAWMMFSKMSIGPFALMDKVGLDTVYNIEMSYYLASSDPKDKPPEALFEKIQRGELGVKTGKGFYSYNQKNGDAL